MSEARELERLVNSFYDDRPTVPMLILADALTDNGYDDLASLIRCIERWHTSKNSLHWKTREERRALNKGFDGVLKAEISPTYRALRSGYALLPDGCTLVDKRADQEYSVYDRREGTPFLGVLWQYYWTGHKFAWWHRAGDLYRVGGVNVYKGEDIKRVVGPEEVPLFAKLAVLVHVLTAPYYDRFQLWEVTW